MAELERAERNDVGRAREWLARAVHAPPDPAWTADGHVSDHWLPASPVTGRLDALEWRVPVTGMASLSVIEPEAAPPAPVQIASEAPLKSDEPPPDQTPTATVAQSPSSHSIDEPPQQTPASKLGAKLEIKPEPIIPLILVPDDPGPDAVDENEPHAEQDSGGWRKIFG
jgi:HemY protein